MVPRDKILLPPLHIKLGLMKQFYKSLRKNGECWKYLCSKFLKISETKLNEGFFVGPDISRLLCDSFFSKSINPTELEVREAFGEVVHNFLGNTKKENYNKIVKRLRLHYEPQNSFFAFVC